MEAAQPDNRDPESRGPGAEGTRSQMRVTRKDTERIEARPRRSSSSGIRSHREKGPGGRHSCLPVHASPGSQECLPPFQELRNRLQPAGEPTHAIPPHGEHTDDVATQDRGQQKERGQEYRAKDGVWQEESPSQRGDARAHGHHLVVLPHEDAEAYQKRVRGLDRRAQPARRPRPVPGRAGGAGLLAARPGRLLRAGLPGPAGPPRGAGDRRGGGAEAAALLKTLYETPDEAWQAGTRQDGPRMSSAFGHLSGGRREAPAAESPAALVRKLEATAGGCRGLLGEWDRLREKAVAATRPDPVLGWDWGEMRCAFRLLGYCQDEVKLAAAFDRRLGLLAKVYAVVEDRACRKILLTGCEDDPRIIPRPGVPATRRRLPCPSTSPR